MSKKGGHPIHTRYEKEQLRLRREILQAALEIAEQHGWSKVSVREIAKKIEYSTTKIYELFRNKDHIVLDILRQGFHLLACRLEEAIRAHSEPEDQATALTRAYCRFAWEQGAYYRVMYGMDGVPFGVKETWQEGLRIGQISQEVIARLLPHCEAEAIERYVYGLWGTLHGICSLFMAGRLYGDREQAEKLALDTVWAMVDKDKEAGRNEE